MVAVKIRNGDMKSFAIEIKDHSHHHGGKNI